MREEIIHDLSDKKNNKQTNMRKDMRDGLPGISNSEQLSKEENS